MLLALSSYAVAQQCFQPVASYPDFLIERAATGMAIVAFALILLVVPPAILLLIEAAAGLVGPRLRFATHLVFVAALVTLAAWQRLHAIPPGAAVGVLVALVYARFAVVRLYMTVLSLAAAVFLVAFLVFSPVRTLVFGGDGPRPRPFASSGAPVVMVVFDELPVAALMDGNRHIDRTRFPAFARLAARATWFRNATSVGDSTPIAIPSLLTGRAARFREQPVAADHPESLFTLLGGTYRMDVSESVTELCGRGACPDRAQPGFWVQVRKMLSDIVNLNVDFPVWGRERVAAALAPAGRDLADNTARHDRSVRRYVADPAGSRSFIGALRTSGGRTLNYAHVVMPHRPWKYLPSGQTYPIVRPDFAGYFFGRWPRDRWITRVAYQRFLLQLGATDRVLGQTLRRLRELHLYDRSLIVVTADHGESFRPGEQARRATRGNLADVASVPLIIKRPHQQAGRIDDRYVESTDVLPTIAAALRMRIPWRTDGKPAGEVRRSGHEMLTVQREVDGKKVVSTHAALAAARDASVLERHDIYLIGPDRNLVGQPVDRLERFPRGVGDATVDGPSLYRAVDPSAAVVPVNVTGLIHSPPARRRPIAVALNGRVAATTWTIADRGRPEYYTALVRTGSLRRGRNRVEVFAIERRSRRVALRPLSGRPAGG